MKVLSFIAQHWDDILVVILLVLGIIAAIRKWVATDGVLFGKMSAEERIAYITRLIANLVPIALALVTDAEIEYGGGTGQLKRSAVMAALYDLIPDEYKQYVSEDNLDYIIDTALDKARLLWEENSSVTTYMKEAGGS